MPPALPLILTYLRRYILLVAVVLFFLALSFAYASGYRPGPGLSIVRTGTLTLAGLPRGAIVYADETPRGTSYGRDMHVKLVPGSHSIIIDMPGGYPWNDIVSLDSGRETRIVPINVPKELQKRLLLSDDERARVATLAKEHTLPSAIAPLPLEGGCALIAVSGKRVLATGTTTPECSVPAYLCTDEECAGQTIIFETTAPVHAVLPVPGREDALLIAYGTTIALIELNPLSPQFFAPLYEGPRASIIPWSEDSFVMIQGPLAYEIRLP